MGFCKSATFVLIIAVVIGCYMYRLPEYRKYVSKDIQQWIDEKTELFNKEYARAMDGNTGSTSKKAETNKEEKDAIKTKSEKIKVAKGTEKIFTKDQLWNDYRGTEGSKGLYLAYMGKVYDVSKGKQYYQPGGGYSFFSGRDGTKAFATGDFTEEGLTDDLLDLSPTTLVDMKSWSELYEKDYVYVGKVVGFFYDENGQETPNYELVKKKVKEGEKINEIEEEKGKILPGCNSEWKPETGSRVWCTTMSAGVKRSWAGVPRALLLPGQKEARCVCVRDSGPPSDLFSDIIDDKTSNNGDLNHPNLKPYEGCKATSFECPLI